MKEVILKLSDGIVFRDYKDFGLIINVPNDDTLIVNSDVTKILHLISKEVSLKKLFFKAKECNIQKKDLLRLFSKLKQNRLIEELPNDIIKLSLDINNLCLCIKTKDEKLQSAIKKRFNNLLVNDDRKCDFVVELQYFPKYNYSKRRKNKKTPKVMNVALQSLLIDIYWKEKRATLRFLHNLNNLDSNLNFFFRLFFALYLFENKAFLLHSSSSIYKGKAFIFCGHSGSGKTTISNLLKNKMLPLTNDLTPIIKSGENFIAQALPFDLLSNKLRNFKYPIAAIFKLKKAKSFKIIRLSYEDSLKLLLLNLPLLPNTEQFRRRMFFKAEAVVKQTPCFQLCFPKKRIPFYRFISSIKERNRAHGKV